MKKIFLPIAICSGLLLASCADNLDIEQKAASSTETFYKTDADAESAVTAMYAQYTNEIGGTEGIWNAYIMGLNYSADDVFAAGGDINDHEGFRIINEFRYDASADPVKALYNHCYAAIYSANLVINYFGGEKADSPIKKKAVAEARVMRAWAHMLLAQTYYQPPMIDHLLAGGEKPVNVESQQELLKWCVTECEEAIPDLPERESQSKREDAYRVTKGFAQFVGGKSAVFAGDMAKAAQLLKPLVESSKYALVPGERFRDLFHVEGDGCEEKIFEFNYTTNTALGGVWGGSIQRGRWMVANVLNWRGDDIPGGGKSPKICATGGWGGGSINDRFAAEMYANDGDSWRRKATFLTADEWLYNEDLCGWQSDADCPTIADKKKDPNRGISNVGVGSFSRSTFMEVKMMCHPNDVDLSVGDNCNNTNMCLARLGEAYLLYAEACLESGQTAEGEKYLHKIQQRAGAPVKALTLKNLQDEKQYELWFEGCRWHDIVRWGIAEECYNTRYPRTEIPYVYDAFFKDGEPEHRLYVVHRNPLGEANINPKFIKGKHEYFPIPQDIIDLNPAIHQVRGWATE